MPNEIETMAPADPKVRGQIQGFTQVLATLETDLEALKEKRVAQEGIRSGSQAISAQIQGMMAPIQKAVAADTMPPEEAQFRRDTILAAKAVAEEVSSRAEREVILLKGEARAMSRQLQTIRKLHQSVLDGERRKRELAEDQDELRASRAKPAKKKTTKPKTKAKTKAKTSETGS